jgi:hypothetical protein
MQILDQRGKRILDIFKTDDEYPANRFYTFVVMMSRNTTEDDISVFVDKARKAQAVTVCIQEYSLTAYVPVGLNRLPRKVRHYVSNPMS